MSIDSQIILAQSKIPLVILCKVGTEDRVLEAGVAPTVCTTSDRAAFFSALQCPHMLNKKVGADDLQGLYKYKHLYFSL